jgi:hypothetical protein
MSDLYNDSSFSSDDDFIEEELPHLEDFLLTEEQIPKIVRDEASESMKHCTEPSYIMSMTGARVDCYWHVRRASINAPLQGYYMDKDGWILYRHVLDEFVDGYQYVHIKSAEEKYYDSYDDSF